MEEAMTELAAVLHHHSARWLQIGTAILRNRADAEDVLNESVRRMLRRNIHFPSPEGMRKYLARTVGNTTFELYRRRKRERQRYAPVAEKLLTSSAIEHIDPFRPDFIMEEEENYAEQEKHLRILRRGLSHISAKQYQALQMTMYGDDDTTFRELESASGIPSATIRDRSRKGVRALRKYLKREILHDV